MTDRDKCNQKAQALVDELSALYGIEFHYLIAGADECFDIRRYGSPTIYISGGIDTDTYYVDIWEHEHSKGQLYSSYYERIPKPVMIHVLDKLLKRKVNPTKQMELF
jgi:hypothetical protein